MINLTEHFTLSRMTKSNMASKLKIKNIPNEEQIENLRNLCKYILEPIYETYGDFIVSSGFRNKQLNAILHGAINSQHTAGQAADIEVPSLSNYELAKWIKTTLDFDQLILEFFDRGADKNSGWVHVSYNIEGNRNEVLHSYKFGKVTRYSPGLDIAAKNLHK